MAEKTPTLDKIIMGVTIACAGAGIYHGFCKAQGMDIPMDTFQGSTLYGPTLLFAGFNAIKFQVRGEGDKTMAASLAGIVYGALVTGAGYGLGYLAGMIAK